MIPPDYTEGKAELFVDFEDQLTILDALGLCHFYRELYTWDVLREILLVVTGFQADKDALLKQAEAVSAHIR